MATESPIRMIEERRKWTPHTRFVDEEALLVNGRRYRGDIGIVPNRSGSAPPNMQGSLLAIENIMQNSVLNANLTSLTYDWVSRGPRGQLVSHLPPDMIYSSKSGFDQQFALTKGGKGLGLSSFRGSSDNFSNLSQGFLPTHKEESEDDKSPQKSSDDVADKNLAVWSQHHSSPLINEAGVTSDLTKDELTSTRSPANDKPNTLHRALLGDESNKRNANSPFLQTEDFTVRASENQGPVSGDAEVSSLQSSIKALKVTCPPNLDHHGSRGERPQNFQGKLLPHQAVHQSGNVQFQSSNNSCVVGNHYFHDGQFPSTEVQPVLRSSGFTPPLYAPGATFMHSSNPYYFGAQQSGFIYPSQYGMGGYPYNTSIPPSFITGYPPHATVPLAFDGISASPDVNSQVPGSWDVQQLGFPPPSMVPRLQFHQNIGLLYNFHGQVDYLTLTEGILRNHVDSFEVHRPQHQGVGVQSNVSQRRGDIVGTEYSGNSVNMGFYMPVPNTALVSPVFPGSPIGGNNPSVGRSGVSSPNSARSAGFYAGWRAERGFENLNHQKPYSLLEELKSGKGRRFELSEIAGHVAEFSVDQYGSRFIQQKLENCSVEDKSSVFQEIVPHACKLMTDVFGNYVTQKFFEYGTPDQRRDLAKAISGHILPLSLQMYGCRVIQKALDAIELDQKIELVRELDGHVMKCVRDQNGNHVVQKCIECVPSERIGFIISAFRGQIAVLSMHPYGCRVIQRVLEHCADELQSQFIMDEILESVCTLAHDQYGNYVTQHILERGKLQERSQIIKNLCGQVVKMSQHKFASNVVEKCLEYGNAPSRELIISEVVGKNEEHDNLLVMMKDQYANYVVQKILEKCSEDQRELLLGRVRVHLDTLKKYTYGKHIVARFEQLFGEISAPTS